MHRTHESSSERNVSHTHAEHTQNIQTTHDKTRDKMRNIHITCESSSDRHLSHTHAEQAQKYE